MNCSNLSFYVCNKRRYLRRELNLASGNILFLKGRIF